MSNCEAAFYQIINTDALNHVVITEAYPDMRACTHTQMQKNTCSFACMHTQSHSDVKAIGCSSGEANSRSRLLMATGSRGAGRDVDNDNVTPSQPALKNGTGLTHLPKHMQVYWCICSARRHTRTHLDTGMEEQFSSNQVAVLL